MKNNDKFKTEIKNWLTKHGYPLEMMVAQAFKEADFSALQSEYYDDPESGKSREIDVLASKVKSIGGVNIRIAFVVECKMSHDAPWLLFCWFSNLAAVDWAARIIYCFLSSNINHLLSLLHDHDEMKKLPIFRFPERVGYSLVRALKAEGHDVPYKAIMSASKAALAQVIRADKKSVNGYSTPTAEIVFPVVVIDAPLFDCYLGDESNVEVEESLSGVLQYHDPMQTDKPIMIDIVSLADLPRFVANAAASCDVIFRLLETEFAAQVSQMGKTREKPSV